MPAFRKGDRVSFTFEAIEPLFGLAGIIVMVRRSGGHYVYDIKLSIRPNLAGVSIPGIKFTARGVLTGISGGWVELSR
jgi:hypothetical protein